MRQLTKKKPLKLMACQFWLGLLLVLCNCSLVISQELFYEQFTQSDGLPSMQTYEMEQDSNGILWVGTENGLVSFDGESFTTYSHPDLINNDIIEISLDKNGRVYFMNLGYQFAYVENGKVELVNTSQIKGAVKNVFINRDTNYVFLIGDTDRWLYTFQESKKNKFEFQKTKFRFFFETGEDYEEFLISETQDSVFIDSDKFRILDYNQSSKVIKTETNKYFVISGLDYVIEVDSILFKFLKGVQVERVIRFGYKYFVVCENTLKVYDALTGNISSYFDDLFINTVFVDNAGNLWISTRSEGLINIPNANMQFETTGRELLSGIAVQDIISDKEGNIYVASKSGDVYLYNNKRRVLKQFNFSTFSRPINFFEVDGVIHGFSLKLFIKIDTKAQVAEDYFIKTGAFKSMLPIDDVMMVGTGAGLHKVDYNKVVTSNFKEDPSVYLNNQWISALHYKQSNNRLIIGTNSGLYYSSFGDSLMVDEISGDKKYAVTCILEDRNSNIWVGTQNAGILLLQGDQLIEKFNSKNGLSTDNILDLQLVDDELYVHSTAGIRSIELSTSTIKKPLFLEGLVSDDINAFKIINDEYWIGTKSGLTVIPKEKFSKFSASKPILSLRNIFVNGSETEFLDEFELEHDANTILLNYNNVTFNDRTNKSFKYRINQNSEWTYSKDPFVRLQSLKPGSYTVEALGLNGSKMESNPIVTSFKILPPWWETTLARFFGLALIMLIFFIILQTRSRRIRKEETLKRDYLSQINRIKDQALQLQMNPHFIFNSLNAIQGFIGTDEEEKAMNFLARFARLIRLIFEHSKGNTISLEEEIEFMQLYIDLEKLRFKDKVDVQLNIDPALDEMRDMVKVPPLLIQPIAENSFKHGLFHKKGQGILRIDYSLANENILQIVVEDNGIGREKAAEISKSNSDLHVSSGIKTTEERIDILNFEKSVKTNTISIIDLYDSSGKAIGTKTTLSLAI